MKTLERQFFKFCCRNIDHDCENINKLVFIYPHDGLLTFRYNFSDLMDKFIETHQEVSKKQLLRYLEKWEKFGFLAIKDENHPGTIYDKVFNFSKLPYEYFKAIPERTLYKLKVFSPEGNCTKNIINYFFINEMSEMVSGNYQISIKESEKQFFKFCCKNIDHNYSDLNQNFNFTVFRFMDEDDKKLILNDTSKEDIRYNFNTLIEKYHYIHPEVSKKQLKYYVKKWFAKYTFAQGNMELSSIIFETMPFCYFQLIPTRILSHCKYLKNISLDDNDTYTKNRIMLNRQLKTIKRGEI